MVAAYQDAAAAGIPPALLFREQVNWLNAREAAARRSPAAIAGLYRERIRDLLSEASAGER
ncbi:MAG TPA: hypothetical protein VFE18_02160 [Phenylobacterium sp.]|uniref:hypothetical protein n=1 Tax=Phenylobacterium sp. TaxID=1871053 RepID=UPI002D57C275|nr:hypothetical protein [Phenylobacterium sp.]HZZ66952.1 hypothetical protein [Phenylobacterium sp.]